MTSDKIEVKQKIMFQIDQLRKDKMVYALESIAVTFICELVYVLYTVLTGNASRLLALLCILIPVLYFLFMGIGNLMRYRKIKELEKKL